MNSSTSNSSRIPEPLGEIRRILGGAALLLALWSLFLWSWPRRAVIAETNYQSNLIRLQRFLRTEQIGTLMVGSSISGRLLPEHFSRNGATNWINLGMDGSGPALGLELARTRKKLPSRILIEANLLAIPPGRNDAVLREHVESLTSRLAGTVPILRAESRPSALLYSLLKQRSDHKLATLPTAVNETKDSMRSSTGTTPTIQYDRTSPEEKATHAAWLRAGIAGLKTAGVEVILVRFPVADPAQVTGDLASVLAQEQKLTLVNLRDEFAIAGRTPAFTDGTHLNAASAETAAALLIRKIGF